jgi:salicylate hydroxylase
MPFTVFHRAELLEVLRDAARDIPIHLDHECLGVTQGPDSVSVRFAGGRQVQADVVVGADGLRSAVRASLGDSRRDSLRRVHRVARDRPFPHGWTAGRRDAGMRPTLRAGSDRR